MAMLDNVYLTLL